jgi:hypothetical protein
VRAGQKKAELPGLQGSSMLVRAETTWSEHSGEAECPVQNGAEPEHKNPGMKR